MTIHRQKTNRPTYTPRDHLVYFKNKEFLARFPLRLTLLLFVALLPSHARGGLLLTEAINESVPQYSVSPIDSVDFKIFLQDSAGLMAAVPVFEQTFTELDSGTSLVFDSGSLFAQAADLLTNDIDDFVTVYVGPVSNTYNESSFFGLMPDFYGNQITSVVANLDTIEIVALGQILSTYVAQVDFMGSLQIYGQNLPEPGGILLGLFALIGFFAVTRCQRFNS
ncbi:MAG: hypothetical protein N2B57_02895 [Planctomycetales bacterium]